MKTPTKSAAIKHARAAAGDLDSLANASVTASELLTRLNP